MHALHLQVVSTTRAVEAGEGASRSVEHGGGAQAAAAAAGTRRSASAALALWLAAVLVFVVLLNLYYRQKRFKPLQRSD